MFNSRFTTAVGGALVLASVWACSDSTSPGSSSNAFTQEAAADLAPSAGQDVAADFNFYVNASATSGAAFDLRSSPSGGQTTARSAWLSSGCTYDSGTEYFMCPTLNFFGHKFTAKYQLLDAGGTAQSLYDNVTTASVHFVTSDTSTIAITFNQQSFGDTSSRHHDATVSGLTGTPDTVHTWNGTGSGTIASGRTGHVTKSYNFAFNDTTSALRIGQPRSSNPYPLSGTIVKNYTVTRHREGADTVTRTATVRVTVTFNGTATVPLLVGTTQYTLNLDTGVVTKATED